MQKQFQKTLNLARFLPFLIFTAVVLVFRNALSNGFVDWDDGDYVFNNKFIRSFSPDNLREMFTNVETANWHPVTWLSHAFDYLMFGLNPAGHHFVGIILHGLNAVWVYFIFLRLGALAKPDWKGKNYLLFGGAMAALLFACHPLRVESVVWASERKDLLSAFFMFPAVLTYLSFVAATDPGARKRWYFYTALLFVLALMSKPMVVTFPVVLLILDIFPLKRLVDIKSFFRLLWEKAPFFILSLACGILAILTQKVSGAVVPVEGLGLDTRLLNAARAFLFYLWKTIWPYHLVPLYPYPKGITIWNPVILVEVISFLMLPALCLLMWRRGKKIWFVAWLYYFVTVLPVIGILQVGRQGAADRYAYIPTLSFYILVGLGITLLLKNYSNIPRAKQIFISVLVAGGIVLGTLTFLTDRQVAVWRDTETLWLRVTAVYPRKVPVAHFNLGRLYQQMGWREKAKKEYNISWQSNPKYIKPLNHLGLMAMEEGNLEKAEMYFRKGIESLPDAILHTNLGLVFFQKKELSLAKEQFLIALKINPQYSQANNNLGMVYGREGKFEKAESYYKKAIKSDPDSVEAFANLGILYRDSGSLSQAESVLVDALNLNPENPVIHNVLGEVYLMAGLNDLAEKKFREALTFNPGYQPALKNLEKLTAVD